MGKIKEVAWFMVWQRARTEEQKKERSEAILKAATKLFLEKHYSEITFNGIAREAGLNKASLYRYYSSREEIFLKIFEKKTKPVFSRLKVLLKETIGTSTAVFTEKWLDTFWNDPDFVTLLRIVPVSMEEHCSEESLIENKMRLYRIMQEVIDVLPLRWPLLSEQQAHHFVIYTIWLISGSSSMVQCNEIASLVRERPELEKYKINGKQLVSKALETLLKSMLSKEP
jgi:AcrR family transcriptional regulator